MYYYNTDPIVWAFNDADLTHLTNASTVSDDSAGDGAITTSASPSSTSSHNIWMWKNTG